MDVDVSSSMNMNARMTHGSRPSRDMPGSTASLGVHVGVIRFGASRDS